LTHVQGEQGAPSTKPARDPVPPKVNPPPVVAAKPVPTQPAVVNNEPEKQRARAAIADLNGKIAQAQAEIRDRNDRAAGASLARVIAEKGLQEANRQGNSGAIILAGVTLELARQKENSLIAERAQWQAYLADCQQQLQQWQNYLIGLGG
jgi:hypothetical protein